MPKVAEDKVVKVVREVPEGYREVEVEVGRYINKDRGMDFATYEGFVGPQLKRIKVKFRKEVKNLPEESCILLVANEDLSIDNRGKYPQLWIHKITEIRERNSKDNSKALDDMFGVGNLPF